MRNHTTIIRLHSFLLHTADAFMILFAFFVAFYLREASVFQQYFTDLQPLETYLRALPVGIFLFWIIGHTFELYSLRVMVNAFSDVYQTVHVSVIWILTIMAISYLAKYDYSRLIVLQLAFYSVVGIIFLRSQLRIIFNSVYQKGIGAKRILIVGAGRPGKEIAKKIEAEEDPRNVIIGYLDNAVRRSYRYPVLGEYIKLRHMIQVHLVNEVYITDPSLSHTEIMELMSVQIDLPVQFKVTANLFELIGNDSYIFDLDSIPSMDIWRIKQAWWAGCPKRVFDLIIATLIFLISMPVFVIVSFALLFIDGWPVFFTHKRVGENGEEFTLYKFRTMKKDVQDYDVAPADGEDPRITCVGKVLRKTSLDELPQLLNVIKGDMSLVGPRPEMPFIVEQYSDWQRMRLKVKPGLTGLWQILGRKDLPLHDNIQYDFYYITNQSFFLDVSILLRTVPVVLFGRGAW